MPTNRYTQLGCKFREPPKKCVPLLESVITGLGNYPPDMAVGGMHTQDIGWHVDLVALHHLGYPGKVPVEKRINQGLDIAIDYFFGEWLNHDTEHDTVPKDVWFGPFSEGLFLGLLSERWHDVAKLCSWATATKLPGYQDIGPSIEVEVCQLYLSLAASLRPEPMRGLKKVEDEIRKSRGRRPRLLFAAWESARAGDQPAFDKALRQSLAHFDTNYPANPYGSPSTWIALHQSVLTLTARRLGLQLPDLPPRHAAMLVTRESLGLS